MKNCKELKDEVLALAKKIEQATEEETRDPNNDIRIVILQRGWVMVGRYKRIEQYCTLDNAFVIRVFGTTKGLGQLASEGPIKDKTILDSVPQVEFHALTEIANLKCSIKVWKEICQ